MNRKGGPNRKVRSKLTRESGEKGKLSIRRFLQSLKIGDRVKLMAEPSIQKGRFPLRFYGKSAVVKAKQGNAYMVSIKDHDKEKSFIVHPIHLKKE